MRTFKFADDKSYKFWNIELIGSSFTVTYGRIGTQGQTQTKDFADLELARKAHDKLIAEKLEKGYVETTSAQSANTNIVLERALVAEPDDLAAHAAYADYLSEQGDPRGEFIQVQLQLEDETRSAKERKELQKREKKLLADNERQWLGDLADTLMNPPEGDLFELHDPALCNYQYKFARGWLDTLHIPELNVNLARQLARCPELRLLRRLHIYLTSYFEEEEFTPGQDVPEHTEHPALYPLLKSQHLSNLRVFQLGLPYIDSRWGGACHTDGEAAAEFVAKMPRIEELHLLAHHIDTAKIFALKSLASLRILEIDHCHNYPLEILARNPNVTNITHLLFHPHGLDHQEPYLRMEHLRAVIQSKHLKNLRHLRLCCSDLGDPGCHLIRTSGILGRIKVLELCHGCITDDGAKELIEAPEAKNIE